MNINCAHTLTYGELPPTGSAVSLNAPLGISLNFMASVAHDMRNPLSVIAGATHILKEDGQLNEDEKKLMTLWSKRNGSI